MERKTESELLDEYIDKYRPYPEGISKEEYRELISDTRGFASHKVDYHVSMLGNTLKCEITMSVEAAKIAFNKLANKLNSLRK